MTATVGSESSQGPLVHQRKVRTWGSTWLRRGMEAWTLVLVLLAPWPFGSVHAIFESLLLSGVGLLTVLWSVRILWQRRFTLRLGGVSICLAGIVLLGLWQMTPLAPSVVSRIAPGTARIETQLLPNTAETLSDGQSYEPVRSQDRSTLTVYRYVTRQDVVRWLAILLLFLAVRNNVASAGSMRRLSVVLLINGVLLSYFALAQWFTSPHNTLYWTYPSLGSAFGPFVNRNHFAFYMNICVGLSLGLLLYVTAKASQARFPVDGYGESGGDRYRRARRRTGGAWHAGAAQLLQNPRTLWIMLALVLMIATVVMCLSRGGVLALIAGSAVCFLVARSRRAHRSRSDVVVLVIALVLALLTWFGFDLAQSRYATLWSGQIPDEGRWQVWNYMLPAVRDFPIWGSGYGTFPYVEPLYRTTARGLELFWDYAHNEYLQMAIEGGVTSLILVLLAIVLVYRAAVRAHGHYAGSPTAGLVLGGVFALTTVVVHSFVEFGMHMPAIACLVVVLCAQLTGLGDTARGKPAPGEPNDAPADGPDRAGSIPQLGGLIPVLAAVTGVLLAITLHLEGRRADYAERFRLAAFRAARDDNVAGQTSALRSAVKIASRDAALHEELAKACFAAIPGARRLAPFDQLPAADREYLLEAERHWLIARDLCPLLAEPQAWLAANASKLATGDDLRAYLQRALRIRPFDPKLWYIKGLYAMERGAQDESLRCWKKSLELAPTFLAKILEKCAGRLQAERLLQDVLPDDPKLLYDTAVKLGGKTSESLAARRLVLEHALQLIDQERTPRDADSYVLEARVHKLLDQPDQALDVYRTALQQDTYNVDLRYEYAQLLYQQGMLREARTELRTIVRRKPSHRGAARLLKKVLSDMLRTGAV